MVDGPFGPFFDKRQFSKFTKNIYIEFFLVSTAKDAQDWQTVPLFFMFFVIFLAIFKKNLNFQLNQQYFNVYRTDVLVKYAITMGIV